ncbi:MAG: phosphatase PAP2 family protein [Crocinitomicaceae bacterium]|nr:phosphatase PAP2 family protein [Crocinitomicaceae bacterium]
MNDILIQYDRELFLFLNGMHNATFDWLMWWISDEIVWIPFYVFLLYLLYKEYGFKGLWFTVVMVVVAVAVTDQASVKLFKNVFMRYRPSHNLEIKDLVHIVNDYRGGMYGFVSSHAANSFVLATTIGMLLRSNKILVGLWLWAALVSYSRIYLGVHYPSDILGGAFLGLTVGYVIYSFGRSYIPEKE